MKILKILTLIFLLTNTLYSSEDIDLNLENDEFYESDWNYFGEFKTFLVNIEKTKENPNIRDFHELVNYYSLQFYVDYFKDGFYFSATPYAYAYNTKSGSKLSNSNYSKPCDNENFFFRSLYMSYSPNDNLSFGVGVLPLSNSFPMQYTSDYYQDGEGLTIINDMDPLAAFIKYRFSDSNRIIVGFGSTDTYIIPSGRYINEHLEEDTYSLFLTQTITYDKFKIINDFKYSNVKYNNSDMGKLYNAGTGIAWDDSEYSGYTFYNIFALSLYDSNAKNVESLLLADNPAFTPAVISSYPSFFAFSNDTYKGAANLFGFRKDIDILNFESFINIEWFHTFGDWASMNKGSPYNSNCNHMSNIRDDSYFINYGIRINELSTLQINYTYIEFDEIQNVATPSSTPVTESYGPQRSSSRLLKVSFSYKF
jgi:hypothetical protein